MTNLFRNISEGLKKMIFGPFVHWITLKRELLNACGFHQNEADGTSRTSRTEGNEQNFKAKK